MFSPSFTVNGFNRWIFEFPTFSSLLWWIAVGWRNCFLNNKNSLLSKVKARSASFVNYYLFTFKMVRSQNRMAVSTVSTSCFVRKSQQPMIDSTCRENCVLSSSFFQRHLLFWFFAVHVSPFFSALLPFNGKRHDVMEGVLHHISLS